jgi:prepilin-type N-terminal cleavage/methylation domain-containing protein
MSTRRSRGFTLVELLLAVVIIGVLAGLLFPVLMTARKQARMTSCTANLRQLSLAYGAYMADYGAYPDPLHVVRSAPDRRILFCPEDPDKGDTASSYTFRTLLPPDFKPYWERPEVDPNTVLLTCNHHLEQNEEVQGNRRTVSEPRYPFKLALRAGGAVERIHVSRVREVFIPGDRPTYTRVYPGESGYERAMR